MAELTIRLRCNPETGKPEIRVALLSDEDALPSEHECDHRKLLKKLLPTVDLEATSDEHVAVERERPAQEPVLG